MFLGCSGELLKRQAENHHSHKGKKMGPQETMILFFFDNDTFKKMEGLPWWLSGKESTCPSQETHVRSLVWEDTTSTEQLSPCATTTEPVFQSLTATIAEHMCCNHRDPRAPEPCSATREATAVRSPCTTMKSSSCSLQLEKSHAAVKTQRHPK